jgi:hypothetical protein
MQIARHGSELAAKGEAHEMTTICGVITTKDVIRHSATIVREFGAGAYFRCCVAILLRRRTTFLNCVCELEQK